MSNIAIKYDLEERTSVFSEAVIDLCKICPKNITTIPIINQLIRSATSIGANYFEANGASSKKESKETQYWLRLLSKAEEMVKDDCKVLLHEVHELTLIFSKISSSIK